MSNNTRLALQDYIGPQKDFLEKLSSDNGSMWLHAFNKFLRKENPWEITAYDFPIWKTIKLGMHKSADNLRKALEKKGYRISSRACDVFNKVAVSSTKTEVDLLVISVADLGFKEGANRKDIYERALKIGLELCPAEVGPQLRLQYGDQSKDEFLFIGMEPIFDSGDASSVFFVRRHGCGDLWLRASYGGPDGFWYGSHRWVFLRRK